MYKLKNLLQILDLCLILTAEDRLLKKNAIDLKINEDFSGIKRFKAFGGFLVHFRGFSRSPAWTGEAARLF